MTADTSTEIERASMDIESALGDVDVELIVVLGKSTMPIEHLLRMGRGAIIELDTDVDDDVWMIANNKVIARCQVLISGDKLAVTITDSIHLSGYE